ncbi:MAG: DUF2169 domain-containing protein, partial [Polyangiaceae bacterium]|nr:DUF2169 domain-containing protein [Polyangiaceae bacterium]
NAAPRDQQLDMIRSGERLVLEHLHREHPRLVTSLRPVNPQAYAETQAAPPAEIPMICDTLWIDTDRALCTLTWRGQMPLQHPAQEGRVLVAMASSGQRLSYPDVARLRGEVASRGPASSPVRPPAPSGQQGAVQIVDPKTVSDARDVTASPDDLARFRAAMPFLDPKGPITPVPRPAAPPAFVRPAPPPVPMPPPMPPVPPMPPPIPSPAMPPPIPSPAIAPPPPEPASSRATSSSDAWLTSSPSLRSGPSISTAAAAQSGAAAASTAAAAASALPEKPRAAPAKSQPSAPSSARTDARELLDLLWFDPESVRRMRSYKPWKAALSEAGEWLDAGSAQKTQKTQNVDGSRPGDRADALRVLVKIKPLDGEGIVASMVSSIDEDSAFTPPLVVVGGELYFPFDDAEILKAYIAGAAPFLGSDKKLREIVDTAGEVLRSPWPGSRGLVESLGARLKEAFVQANRALTPAYLETAAEQALLEQRRYQKRILLGQDRIRALLTIQGSAAPVPTYLPDSLTRQLPMFQRFRAVIVAEAHGQQDQYESHPIALVGLALARVLPIPTIQPR